MPMFGIFPSTNFTEKSSFPPRNQLFSKKPTFPSLIQSTVLRVCGKNARGKIAIGKNVRGKIAIGKNVRAKVVKIP